MFHHPSSIDGGATRGKDEDEASRERISGIAVSW
jgi:hypothetical protein